MTQKAPPLVITVKEYGDFMKDSSVMETHKLAETVEFQRQIIQRLTQRLVEIEKHIGIEESQLGLHNSIRTENDLTIANASSSNDSTFVLSQYDASNKEPVVLPKGTGMV